MFFWYGFVKLFKCCLKLSVKLLNVILEVHSARAFILSFRYFGVNNLKHVAFNFTIWSENYSILFQKILEVLDLN